MILTGQQRYFVRLLESKAQCLSDSDSSDIEAKAEQMYDKLDMKKVSKVLSNAYLKSTLDKRMARALMKQFESIKVTFAD